MAKPSGDDTATHYLAAHRRLVAFVGGLTDDELATPVPATPGWSVQDVVAHLAGITTDALAGRLTGLPTDDDTGKQVAERRGRGIAELLEEWAPNVQPMAEGARAGLVPPNLAVDILTHEQDVRGALGRPPALGAAELRFCTDLYAFGLSYAVKKAGLPSFTVAATDTDFHTVAGLDEPTAAVRATEFELFRALAGRRSRGQVAAFEWAGDHTALVDTFSVFGRLAAQDLVET